MGLVVDQASRDLDSDSDGESLAIPYGFLQREDISGSRLVGKHRGGPFRLTNPNPRFSETVSSMSSESSVGKERNTQLSLVDSQSCVSRMY